MQDTNIVVAIGDLHGHFPALDSLIGSLNKSYNLIENGIIREDAVLVSTGDSIDRGNQALKIIDYFIGLKEKNPDNFKTLIGNHELMALESLDKARQIEQNAWLSLSYYSQNIHGANGGIQFLEEFGETDQKRFSNYVLRMSRIGDVGKWMRKLLPSYETNISGKNILFVHAGIPKTLADRDALEQYLEEYQNHVGTDTVNLGGSTAKYGSPFILDEGVFWDRSAENLSKSKIEDLSSRLGADFIITGHTPHKKVEIYGGRIIDIDVGMCPAYGANTPTALVLKKEGIYVYPVGKPEELIIKF